MINFGKLSASTALVAVMSLAPLAAGASVATNILNVSGDGSTAATNNADAYAADFGAYVPAGATWAPGGVTVVPSGSSTNLFRSPWSGTGAEGTNSYYAVGPSNTTSPNPATLSFGSAQSSFTLLWGSIDSYNTLTFNLTGGGTRSFTGSNIASIAGSACGSPSNYACTAKVAFNFGGGETFDSVSFGATSQAFEFALAPVPLPATGLLLLGGLGGIAALKRRKKAA